MKIPLFILSLGITLLPALAFAQTDMTFQEIPFLSGAGATTTEGYLTALYRVAIAAAAIIAVLRIILAGVKYMFSEIITSKKEAVEDIKGALLGLLIILGAVTILNTINPALTKIDILSRLDRTEAVEGRAGEEHVTTTPVTVDPSNPDVDNRRAAIEAEKRACIARGGTPSVVDEYGDNPQVRCAGGTTRESYSTRVDYTGSDTPSVSRAEAKITQLVDSCRSTDGTTTVSKYPPDRPSYAIVWCNYGGSGGYGGPR
jgi:hypothetical protein